MLMFNIHELPYRPPELELVCTIGEGSAVLTRKLCWAVTPGSSERGESSSSDTNATGKFLCLVHWWNFEVVGSGGRDTGQNRRGG